MNNVVVVSYPISNGQAALTATTAMEHNTAAQTIKDIHKNNKTAWSIRRLTFTILWHKTGILHTQKKTRVHLKQHHDITFIVHLKPFFFSFNLSLVYFYKLLVYTLLDNNIPSETPKYAHAHCARGSQNFKNCSVIFISS